MEDSVSSSVWTVQVTQYDTLKDHQESAKRQNRLAHREGLLVSRDEEFVSSHMTVVFVGNDVSKQVAHE